MIDFRGQSVIVSGAGRGLGRLYALDIAQRGGSVVVNDLGGSMLGEGSDAGVAHEVVGEIVAAGGSAVASCDSVATPGGAAAIVQTAMDRFGRVDAVVSNAGIFDTKPFDELSPERWRTMLNVHLDGSFFLCQPAFRVMKRQGYGRFVMVASSAALFGLPNESHYAAAKAGIFGLSNVMALEGAPYGILSNVLLPTGYSRMAENTQGADISGEPEQLKLANPFRKLIDPEHVVPMVTFLASRKCTFTHRNFAACAGRYSRVFVGLAEGWLAADRRHSAAEDIDANIEQICATQQFTIPNSLFDEVAEVCARRGV
jgi:NAD(P)-dependent dehydrogenase (short-subunit alcohol dehydrogenase family)